MMLERIQVYIRKDDVGEEAYNVFKLLDIGDIIGVNGYPFRTKTKFPFMHFHISCSQNQFTHCLL